MVAAQHLHRAPLKSSEEPGILSHLRGHALCHRTWLVLTQASHSWASGHSWGGKCSQILIFPDVSYSLGRQEVAVIMSRERP